MKIVQRGQKAVPRPHASDSEDQKDQIAARKAINGRRGILNLILGKVILIGTFRAHIETRKRKKKEDKGQKRNTNVRQPKTQLK
jgi:hypothetical protein